MVAIVITVVVIMMTGVEGNGRWSKCIGRPSSDGFKDPRNEYTPAWTGKGIPIGRAQTGSTTCEAWFPFIRMGLFVTPSLIEMSKGSNQFYYLRKFKGGFKDNGEDYKWVSYKDVHYNTVPCTPVKYDESINSIYCFLNQARLKKCGRGWMNANILGGCNEDNGKSWATYCNRAFMFSSSYTMNNAKVLCLSKVARREVEITHADPVAASGYQKPALILTDETSNGGSRDHSWNFVQKYSRKTSSSYSMEHGWRVKVSVSYKSGLLSDAIAKWEASVETEAHGSYTTCNKQEETKEITYTKNFVVPPRTNLKVTVNIYTYKLDIPYVAKEKYYDEKNNFLGEATVRGIWKGVFTFTGKTTIKERKLRK